jgi:hypothetical protein
MPQEGNYRVPGRFCEVSNSTKVGSIVPVRTVQWSVRTLSYVEDSNSSACIRLNVKTTPSGRSSVFKKNPNFLYRHGSGKTACNHSDARETPSKRGLNKKMREAHYGKAIEQFPIRTLYASVQTPPRENWISVDLGLLKPIYRGLETCITYRIRYWIL